MDFNKKLFLLLQFKIIHHYSNGLVRCMCEGCIQSDIEFLSINHTNRIKGNKRHGIKLSKWLIMHNYPEGFRVLCYNCVSSRNRYGYCPHNQDHPELQKLINSFGMQKIDHIVKGVENNSMIYTNTRYLEDKIGLVRSHAKNVVNKKVEQK